MAKQRTVVEEHIFEPVTKEIINAVIFGITQAVTMVWNRSRPPETRLSWALGEMLIAAFVAANARAGRLRDIALGVEAGGIAYILAPIATQGGTYYRVDGGQPYSVVYVNTTNFRR